MAHPSFLQWSRQDQVRNFANLFVWHVYIGVQHQFFHLYMQNGDILAPFSLTISGGYLLGIFLSKPLLANPKSLLWLIGTLNWKNVNSTVESIFNLPTARHPNHNGCGQYPVGDWVGSPKDSSMAAHPCRLELHWTLLSSTHHALWKPHIHLSKII